MLAVGSMRTHHAMRVKQLWRVTGATVASWSETQVDPVLTH